jgi:hypothetical protein
LHPTAALSSLASNLAASISCVSCCRMIQWSKFNSKQRKMKVYTVGYGGRYLDSFVAQLVAAGVRAVVDVRLLPDRACMSAYVKAKSPDKGTERLLGAAGIGQCLPGICEDWRERYAALIHCAGHLLVARSEQLDGPLCLICAERRFADCHRLQIAELLASRGFEIEHLD